MYLPEIIHKLPLKVDKPLSQFEDLHSNFELLKNPYSKGEYPQNWKVNYSGKSVITFYYPTEIFELSIKSHFYLLKTGHPPIEFEIDSSDLNSWCRIVSIDIFQKEYFWLLVEVAQINGTITHWEKQLWIFSSITREVIDKYPLNIRDEINSIEVNGQRILLKGAKDTLEFCVKDKTVKKIVNQEKHQTKITNEIGHDQIIRKLGKVGSSTIILGIEKFERNNKFSNELTPNTSDSFYVILILNQQGKIIWKKSIAQLVISPNQQNILWIEGGNYRVDGIIKVTQFNTVTQEITQKELRLPKYPQSPIQATFEEDKQVLPKDCQWNLCYVDNQGNCCVVGYNDAYEQKLENFNFKALENFEENKIVQVYDNKAQLLDIPFSETEEGIIEWKKGENYQKNWLNYVQQMVLFEQSLMNSDQEKFTKSDGFKAFEAAKKLVFKPSELMRDSKPYDINEQIKNKGQLISNLSIEERKKLEDIYLGYWEEVLRWEEKLKVYFGKCFPEKYWDYPTEYLPTNEILSPENWNLDSAGNLQIPTIQNGVMYLINMNLVDLD